MIHLNNIKGYRRFLIIPHQKLVIICVPAVANLAIKKAVLASASDAQWVDEAYVTDDYEIVAFVRNPLDRIVSLWQDKFLKKNINSRQFFELGIQECTSLESFIEKVSIIGDNHKDVDLHFISQYTQLYSEGNLLPTTVYRFENIKEDWEKLRRRTWYLLPELPLDNKSSDLKTRVSAFHKGLIKNRYLLDYEVFGYE